MVVADRSPWQLYQRRPGVVLGFHGCDKKIGEELLSGKTRHLKKSANGYDWLGQGVYFWEDDPQRAMEFATNAATTEDGSKTTKGQIKEPFVVGAVLDLGLCLNLLDRHALDELREAYGVFDKVFRSSGSPDSKRPVNKGPDRGMRYLDAAVIETLHNTRSRADADYPPYDSVRGAFWEGGELYPGAGFSAKNHVQIAVRNLNCIKGYFRLQE